MDNKMDFKNGSNEQEDKEIPVRYDDILSTAGQLGRYQWILFCSTSPFYAFGVFVYFSQLFITEVPNHWCKIPQLENFTVGERRNLSIPQDANSRFGYSQCEMYDVNWTEVLERALQPDKTWTKVPCRYGWEFNKSEMPYPTIASDFEWVCEKNSYQATAQSIFFLGSILGGPFFGWVADRFGRIPAIISSCLLGCVGGTTSSFAKNLIEFSTARFVMGMSYDTCMFMAYLLFLEYIGPKHRTLMANLSFAIFYSLFVTILPWIALACGHWQTICLVTSLPFGLAIFTKLILPESPRWLLSQGRVDEAVNKVLMIARINRKEVPVKMIDQFKISVTKTKKIQKQNCLDIVRKPVTRKIFILICLVYMCCAILFDGLVRNIGQLNFDFFLTFTLTSITELPSVILVAIFLDYLGRRWMCIICMALTCVFSISIIFTDGVLSAIFAMAARFVVNMTFSTVIQWAPELLPTSVRGSGVATIHICGYLASFSSSYIAYLKVYIFWLPLAIIAAVALLGMCVAAALPETALKEMPQTYDDVRELTRNQRLWTLPHLEFIKAKRQHVGLENLGMDEIEN